MTTSRGAWPFFYTLGLDRRSDPNGRDAHGIYAFKNELIYNGYATGIDASLAYWGGQAVLQTRAFQANVGISIDGVLGPETARRLFRKRLNGQPNGVNLSRIKSLESANDPVAQGMVDPNDEGLFQENMPSNPTLSLIEAWTPSFIVPYAASQLMARINSCGSVKAGIAGWNIGDFYATEWRKAGYPASGGPVVDGQDMWSRATQYVALVNQQPL